MDRVAVRTPSGATATSMYYSGGSIKAAATTTGTTTKSYSRDAGGSLVGVKVGAVARFAGLNAHGDQRFLFDTTGAPTDTKTFDPYGQVLATSGTTGSELGFQADYTDPTTGDVWMGARWYSPLNATFRSRDSQGGQLLTPISLNRYTYANGTPTSGYDPNGHTCVDLGLFANEGVGAIAGWGGRGLP